MKAVFTDNPYKFWNNGNGGELHLFHDNELAKQFLIEVVDDPWLKGYPMLCETPNDVSVSESWANLLCLYGDCVGFDKIVLHPDDEGTNDPMGFIEWSINTAIPYDTGINWTWPSETPLHIDKVYANINLLHEEYTDGTPNPWLHSTVQERERRLCNLLHDLFDVLPFEIYDFYDGNRNTGELMEVDEIAA